MTWVSLTPCYQSSTSQSKLLLDFREFWALLSDPPNRRAWNGQGADTMTARDTADILLVEDSAQDAELALAALQSRNLGHKVVLAVDGEEAMQFICASSVSAVWNNENVPKVILLDLKLRQMGGMEVLQQLKSEARTRSIPVVVLTGSIDEDEMRECYQLGVNSYVAKPADAGKFVKLVGEIAHYWLTVNQPAPLK